jgi:uncharacterized membrane protein
MSLSEKIHYTKVEIILEVISVLTLLTLIIYTFLVWPDVPERIPNHFSWTGIPNSWGFKSAIPAMVYLASIIFILFTILSRFPRAINFPIKIKEDDSGAYLKLRFSLILWIKAELVLITSYIGIQGMRVALGQSQGLGILLGPILIMVLLGTGAIFIYRAAQLKSES